MRKKIISLLAAIVAFALFSTPAYAIAIGASPATLGFDIPKGGSEEKTVSISTNSPDYVGVSVSIAEELKDFIILSPSTNLKTKLGEPLEVKVLAKSSRLAKAGAHAGTITFVMSPLASSSGSGTGSVISSGVAVKVSVNVQGVAAAVGGSTPTVADANEKDSVTGNAIAVPDAEGAAGAKNGLGFLFAPALIVSSATALALFMNRRPRKTIEVIK